MVGGALVPEAAKIEPDQYELHVHYIVRFSQTFSMRFIGEGKYYQKTHAAISGIGLVGFGIAPEFALSPFISVPVKIKVQDGTLKDETKLTGFEAGLGLRIKFQD